MLPMPPSAKTAEARSNKDKYYRSWSGVMLVGAMFVNIYYLLELSSLNGAYEWWRPTRELHLYSAGHGFEGNAFKYSCYTGSNQESGNGAEERAVA